METETKSEGFLQQTELGYHDTQFFFSCSLTHITTGWKKTQQETNNETVNSWMGDLLYLAQNWIHCWNWFSLCSRLEGFFATGVCFSTCRFLLDKEGGIWSGPHFDKSQTRENQNGEMFGRHLLLNPQSNNYNSVRRADKCDSLHGGAA